jgi:hypothetical protein
MSEVDLAAIVGAPAGFFRRRVAVTDRSGTAYEPLPDVPARGSGYQKRLCGL